jgi:hypothetical protein
MDLFQHIFEPLPFKDENKFFINNAFQKVGYYSGFYSSLCDEKQRNGEFVKNKVDFQCILRIWQKHEYTCNSVKSRIIANLLIIIKNTESFPIFERKAFK